MDVLADFFTGQGRWLVMAVALLGVLVIIRKIKDHDDEGRSFLKRNGIIILVLALLGLLTPHVQTWWQHRAADNQIER